MESIEKRHLVCESDGKRLANISILIATSWSEVRHSANPILISLKSTAFQETTTQSLRP